jgi:hypothetical protein
VNPGDRVSLPGVPSTVFVEHPEPDEGGDFRVVTTTPIVPQTQTVQPPLPPGSSVLPEPITVTVPDTPIAEPPSTPPSMSPFPESTPDRTNDTRWTPDLFEISPEPRNKRSPVFPSPDELDHKHTNDQTANIDDKTVNTDDKTVNINDKTVNIDETVINSESGKKNIDNPMSKIFDIPKSVTPDATNAESTSVEPSVVNTPLDDSVEGNEPSLKGVFKPLNLRPKVDG